MTAMSDAREYVSSRFGGLDMSTLPDDAIMNAVDELYPGGWVAFSADFARFVAPHRETAAAPSKLALWAKFTRIRGGSVQQYRRGPLDEILSVDLTTMEALVEVHQLKEHTRRDVSARVGVRLFTAKSIVTVWADEDIADEVTWAIKCGDLDRAGQLVRLWDMVSQSARLEFVRWGRVRTPDYVEAQAEQFETCYRPGGDKTPMQGWVARLGVSHKQAHQSESFQTPKKEQS